MKFGIKYFLLYICKNNLLILKDMERLEELEQKVEDAIISYIKEGGRKEKILDLMKRMEQINK